MSQNIDIHDTNLLLGHAATDHADVIGVVTYEGDIGKAEPNQICIDTQLKKLSVLFNDGSKKELCDLSDENVAVIDELCREIKASNTNGKKSLTVDFNQVDPKEEGLKFFKTCYRLDAMVM